MGASPRSDWQPKLNLLQKPPITGKMPVPRRTWADKPMLRRHGPKITRGRLEPAPRNSALQGPGLRRPKGPEIISCAAARQRIRNTLTLRMNWLCRRGPKAAAGDSKWNHLKGDRSLLLLGGLLLALLLCSFLLSHDQVLLEQKRCLRVSSGFGAPKNLQSLRGVSEQTAHPLEQSCITIP